MIGGTERGSLGSETLVELVIIYALKDGGTLSEVLRLLALVEFKMKTECEWLLHAAVFLTNDNSRHVEVLPDKPPW